MKFVKTNIEGLCIIEPEFLRDLRGYFVRTFCKEELKKHGIDFDIKQANRSFTKQKGTIRGMHFQKPPKAEAKIITCLKGKVYDVAIDLRDGSPTYGTWEACELSEDNQKMFYLPEGFAHGFQTLVPNCELQYFMGEFFAPEANVGIRWDDPTIGIAWPIPNPTFSDKDNAWPFLKDAV